MRSSRAFALRPTRSEAAPAQRASHLLAELFIPLEWLLVSGGDLRLTVSPANRLNVYGCQPFPRAGILAFSSSTAATISQNAYACAERARETLISNALQTGIEDAFDTRLEDLRREIKNVLGVSRPDIEVVLAPSGTDSQLHALFAAQATLEGPLTTIVVAADQTGSGTVFTSVGRHFAERTALGRPVEKGARIGGLADDVECVRIAVRDDAGKSMAPDALDAAVEIAVARAIAQGRRVMLLAMDSSKFGQAAPSAQCVDSIRARWPHSVQFVIDACQGRMGTDRLSAHLERGDIVLVTGSKFFGGPPFSGAMLVPPRVSAALAKSEPPPGLLDYTTRSEWPRAWPRLRAQLPQRPNYGAWLRWEAALAEMRAYFAVPRAARSILLERFAEAVTARIAVSPSLELLPPFARHDDCEMRAPTIFSFLLRRNGALLSLEACTAIYHALNRDMSTSLPASASEHERLLAGHICHIGQPVALADTNGEATAALRISAGARLVSECWTGDPISSHANLERQSESVSIVLEKIELLLAHLPGIAKGPR